MSSAAAAIPANPTVSISWGELITAKYNRWVQWTNDNSLISQINPEADSTKTKVGKIALAILPLLVATVVSAVVSTINFLANLVKKPASAPVATQPVVDEANVPNPVGTDAV